MIPPLESGTVLLENLTPESEFGDSFLFRSPRTTISSNNPNDVESALNEVHRLVSAGYYAAGFVAYEAGGCWIGSSNVTKPLSRTPLVWFGIYDRPEPVPLPAGSAIFTWTGQPETARLEHIRMEFDRETYRERIDLLKKHIREGDIYQVNFTQQVYFDWVGDPFALYVRLRKNQPVPFAACIQTDDQFILSLSPELFFSIRDGRIETRPMKGTAPRGKSIDEDRDAQKRLQTDEKNRAENLMIVDLLRNDLSRICRIGSIEVPALYSIEPYRTVLQMTSTVTGELYPDCSFADLFKAVFPGGSITGAPKRRAMELIHQLEGGPRGIYCGAIGYVAPDRRAVFSVAIRTLVLEPDKGTMGVGSGITWYSDADAEYDECLLKTRFMH